MLSRVNKEDPRMTLKRFADGTKFIFCKPETPSNPTPECVLDEHSSGLALVYFSSEGLANNLKMSKNSSVVRPHKWYVVVKNDSGYYFHPVEYTLGKLEESEELRNAACAFFRYNFHQYLIAKSMKGNKKVFGYIDFKNRAQTL